MLGFRLGSFSSPRNWGVGLAAVAMVTLPASAWWLGYEKAMANRISQQAQRQSVTGPLAGLIEGHLQEWAKVRGGAEAAEASLKAMGEQPELWGHRSITVENQKMSRREADEYLSGLVNTGNTLFVPSAANVRAAIPGESVFVPNQIMDNPGALLVTVKGELYSKAGL